jgi:nucleoid-associated protein YgaU
LNRIIGITFHAVLSYNAQIEQIYKEEHMTQQGQIPTYMYYIVQAGDTLSGIAQRAYNNGSQPYWMAIYRTNQSDIGNDPNLIHPGLKLWIPLIADSPQEDTFYIVQAGDTLSGIAQRVYHNGSQPYWRAIYLVNQYEIGNDPNVIQPGEPLYIPVIVSPPERDTFYIVQAGDTLWDIAQQTCGDGSRWPVIYDDNKKVIGNDPNQIFPGQILYINSRLFKGSPGGGNLHVPPDNPTWPKQ